MHNVLKLLTLSFNCWQRRRAAPMSSTESLSLGIEQSTCDKAEGIFA